MATAPKVNAQDNAAVSEDLLRVEGLTKIYDGIVKAVDNVSLTVKKGEIFGLLGGSGCGKSTNCACWQALKRPQKAKYI